MRVSARPAAGEGRCDLTLEAGAQNQEARLGFFHGLLDAVEKGVKVKPYLPQLVRYIHGEYIEGGQEAQTSQSTAKL